MAKSVGKHIPEIVLNPAAETSTEVLIVDDERDFLKMAKECLESRGNFRAETALSVEDAMRKLKKKNYEVIISDYVMPSKNGLEFLRDLRSSGNNVPFIIFTGKGREEVAIKALNLGASQYLNKNGDPETVYGQLAHSVRQVVQRKSARDRLRASEERYRNLFEMAPDGIVTLDMKGVITSCNAAVMRLTGYYRDEVVGKHFSELGFLNSTDAPRYLALFASILRGEQPKPFEVTWHNKNGTSHVSEFHVSLIKTDDQPIGIQAIARNITDRKITEQRIRENEQKFAQLFKDNPEATIFLDPDFRIADVNPRFTKLFGYSLDEAKGKHTEDLIVPKDRVDELEGLHNNAKNGQVYLDTVRRAKGGNQIFVSVSAAPIGASEKLIGYVVIYRDITDRKKAEEELRESRRHFRKLFDLIVDPVGIVDKKGKILEVTDSVEKITGFKREDLVGRNFLRTKIATAKSKVILMKNLAKRMMGVHLPPYEVEILTKDGRKLPYEVNAAKIEYKGKPADLVVFRDVSQRKKMEEKLRVVGGLTRHDIRNKLSTITGNIYLAKKSLAGHDKTLDYLSDAESAIHQVVRILDFARNYERLGVEKLVPTDVGKAFEGAASLFPSLDNIEIVNSCLGLKILADSLLPQLFYNLIDNSLKHGQKVSQIKFYCEQTKNQLRLIYEDDGVGIPATQKKLVFKEGWGRDTGYGLYLARKTCEVYGWSIEEAGKSGRGVRFIITIPNESSNR
ncbi:PAS domain S-box protein [Candidatus Bathyarchaeota archaeon]|nr:PAS domain S-box protein [Candidatus Bathyarchaeota archaeon]